MDIRKWLDGTVPPDSAQTLPNRPGVESLVHGKTPQVSSGRKSLHRTCPSDSSLLDLSPHRHKRTKRKRELPAGRSTTNSTCSEVLHDTCSTYRGSSPANERYTRKPRRKTRPERYDPSTKVVSKRGKHAYPSHKDRPKKSQKTKRRKDDKAGIGVLQNFHAKNAVGDRLTLKPREQLGIFNKGKTSTAVKGRGLPDLVFSEMKFLQKHTDQPEADQTSAKRKRQRSHVHLREEEISSYFAATSPNLADNHANRAVNRSRHVHVTVPSSTSGAQDPSLAMETPRPTTEPRRKPADTDPRHGSTSFVTWSESNRADSATPLSPPMKPAIHRDQPDPIGSSGTVSWAKTKEDAFKRLAHASLRRQKTEGTTELFGVSSTHPRSYRSRSYPQRASSPRRTPLVDRTTMLSNTDAAASPFSMPPSVPIYAECGTRRSASPESVNDPTTKAASPRDTRTFVRHSRTVVDNDYEIAEMDSQSPDFARVLRHCSDVFHEEQPVTNSLGHQTVRMEPVHMNHVTERPSDDYSLPTTHRPSTMRFAETERRPPTRVSIAVPSIYEQQAQRQQQAMQCTHNENGLQDEKYFEHEHFINDPDISYQNHGWDGLPEELPSFGEEERQLDIHSAEPAYGTGDMRRRLASSHDVFPPGFWRPNRLY